MVKGVWLPSALSRRRNVFVFADQPEAEAFERLDDALLGGISGKLRHYIVTPAAETNASSTGGSTCNTSFPKVSM
jgi:hypothetical protein